MHLSVSLSVVIRIEVCNPRDCRSLGALMIARPTTLLGGYNKVVVGSRNVKYIFVFDCRSD